MWACEAWDSVTPTTIMNCWRKAGICPSSFFSSTPRQEQDSPDSDLRDLNEAINRLEQDSEEIITAEDYVQLSEEDDIEEELTDAELLAMARVCNFLIEIFVIRHKRKICTMILILHVICIIVAKHFGASVRKVYAEIKSTMQHALCIFVWFLVILCELSAINLD